MLFTWENSNSEEVRLTVMLLIWDTSSSDEDYWITDWDYWPGLLTGITVDEGSDSEV